MNHLAFSRRGGKATLAKYGREHFVEIGKKSAKLKMEKYGKEYFVNLSKLGVAARQNKRAT